MPVLDLAPRFSDTYRVRLGDQVGNRPQALTDRIRITAAGPEAPQAFADVYGSVDNRGVTEWQDDKSPDCFEVYLPITALPILIMPGQVLTQWWELYAGKVCQRRCEGTGGKETISGGPCLCSPDVTARIADKKQCNIMTRLSIMCPDVKALLGSGSLVTHSEIAAGAFQGAMYLAGPLLSKGVPVEAVLRTHTHKGRTTFTFPVLEIGGPADRTPELDAGPMPAQIESAGAPTPPALEAGAERPDSDADATSAAPPTHAPFDSSNEKIVDRETALALKDTATEGGLTSKDIFDAVESVLGKGKGCPLNKVHRDRWDDVESAVIAAIGERRARKVPA